MSGVLTEAVMREVLAEEFAQAGLRGRGNFWRLSSPETHWVVHLDRLPYGNRFGLELGLNLSMEKRSPPLKDCELILYVEQLPLGVDFDPAWVLDLNRPPSPVHVDHVRTLAKAVSAYVLGATTLATVRAKFQAGEFRTCFITRDGARILAAT